MTWFKVDDSFHSHPKALATEPAALGLWVVAGSWSSSHLTGGVVPDDVLPRLLPDSARLAEALVTAGLWKRTRGGYRFHDWAIFNPTTKEAKALRDARVQAGRKGGLASAKARSKAQANGQALASGPLEPPSLSSTRKDGARARAAPARPRAPKPKPPWCGVCDQATRLTGDPPRRCAACHPLRAGATS